MVVNMTLAGPAMPVPELEALLPSLGVVLPSGSRLEGGTASVMLAMEGPADKLVTSESLALNNTRLTGFDLSKKMATIEKLAGIKSGPDTEIQTPSSNVRVAPEGASMQDIKLLAPAIGDMAGAGTVSPANDLDFKMNATVHTSGLLGVVGNTPIPFTVQGTCADLIFRPDLKAVVSEKVKNVEGGVGKAAEELFKGRPSGKKD
jgi:AsmA protein